MLNHYCLYTNFPFPQIGHTVISILEDPQGLLWFATSEGLYIYDGETFQPIKISEAAGADNIVSLVNEGGQYLWVGTENGAYRLAFSEFDASVRNRFETRYNASTQTPLSNVPARA